MEFAPLVLTLFVCSPLLVVATLLAPALASTGVEAFEQEVVDRLVRPIRVRAKKVEVGAILRI
jgi:hypothetical protein